MRGEPDRGRPPREAALRLHAASDGIGAITQALVYVGDQIGRLVPRAAPEERVALVARRVKVVALTPRTVLLEIAGEPGQHQLFAGDTLEVPLRVERSGG